jgi:hypothetical protein
MIIIQIFIISCLVFAIHYTFLPGEVFGFVEKWYERMAQRAAEKNMMKLYEFLCKIKEPIYACPVCMAPWHGTYLYWVIPWPRICLPAHDRAAWIIVVICALGLNSIIVRMFKDDK